MAKKRHFLVVRTPDANYLTPRDTSFQYKGPFGLPIRLEYWDSSYDEMRSVLQRICREAGVRLALRTITRKASFPDKESGHEYVVITADIHDETPKPGYFMPLRGHVKADVIAEQLAIQLPELT